MKKHTKPLTNYIADTINWLYNFAPITFKWSIFIIVFLAFINTIAADDNTTQYIIRPIEVIYKTKQLCPCDYTPIGVICSNNVLKLELEPENGCICGNYSLTHWLCKYNPKTQQNAEL